jgi:hypothetical protein
MSGIGSSLADLDKGVRKSVPGGWGTVAGLAAGGAGLYYGLGAGAAGAAASAATPTLGAGTTAAATGATAAGTAATGAGAIEAAGAASAASGIANPFSSASAYQAVVPGLTSSGVGSQAAMLAAQTGEFGLAGLAQTAGSAYAPGSLGSGFYGALSAGGGLSPNKALMANQALGGLSPQQPQGGQQTSIGVRQGQPVNTADPILALLAPKMKKKERISLL